MSSQHRYRSSTLVRALRAAAVFDAATVAAAVGVSPSAASQALQMLSGRGRCDTLTVEWFASERIHEQVLKATSLRWPPALSRLVSAGAVNCDRSLGGGAAGWSGRWEQQPAAPRPVIVAAARETDNRVERQLAAAHLNCPAAVIAALTYDTNWRVRATAAANPNCAAAALRSWQPSRQTKTYAPQRPPTPTANQVFGANSIHQRRAVSPARSWCFSGQREWGTYNSIGAYMRWCPKLGSHCLEMASDASQGERGGFRPARPSNDDRPRRLRWLRSQATTILMCAAGCLETPQRRQ